MRARSWKAIIMILACFFLWGDRVPAASDLEDIAREIARNAPARIEEFEALAREIAEKERSRQEKRVVTVKPPSSQSGQARILLFVTLGEKPEEALERNRRLLREIREIAPDVTVVLRGLPCGRRTLGDLVRYLRRLAGEKGELPGIMLDPPRFRRYGVTVAPTLVYERDGKAVAWARGTMNARWFLERVEREKLTGDIGQWGPTEPIAERDLIEEMQERLAQVDFQALKERAFARYWQKRRYLTLPKAEAEKVFYLDATYEVQEDFILPDGKVVARKGEKIDLFEKIPPTFMLVVFDAGDPRQLAWAVETGKKYGDRYRVKYITTEIPDRENGWQSLQRLYDTLDAPVFLLTEVVRDRFRLARVPSTVRYVKEKHRFEVKEFNYPALKDGACDGSSS